MAQQSDEKREIYIYIIYFPTSNKRYIGLSYSVEKRMKEHRTSNSLVGKALRKYDDWQVTVLHTAKTRDKANLIEIEEIRNHNSVSPNGYNLTGGGEGVSPSEETRVKMRKPKSEEHKAKLRKPKSKEHIGKMRGNKNALGCKHSEESKEKSRKASLGNKNGLGNKGALGRKQTKEHIDKAVRSRRENKRKARQESG